MSDVDDLARRLGEELTRRKLWRKGVLMSPAGFCESWRVCWYDSDTDEAGGYKEGGGKCWGIGYSEYGIDMSDGRWSPDLTDPATVGVLLGLLPHPWTVHSPSGEAPGNGHQEWRLTVWVGGYRRVLHSGTTLGEAVASALLALWEAENA
jgi:hypothetical protein